MKKASIDLQDLRRRLYVKAKAETSWRFWGLYVHICKMETLRQAYALAGLTPVWWTGEYFRSTYLM
jgi:RNA-directed DNA polymerase